MSEAWVQLKRSSAASTFVSLGALATCWGGFGAGAGSFLAGLLGITLSILICSYQKEGLSSKTECTGCCLLCPDCRDFTTIFHVRNAYVVLVVFAIISMVPSTIVGAILVSTDEHSSYEYYYDDHYDSSYYYYHDSPGKNATKAPRYSATHYESEPSRNDSYRFLGLVALINVVFTLCLGILATRITLAANAFIREQGGPHMKNIRHTNVISNPAAAVVGMPVGAQWQEAKEVDLP
jgi:hypothetical protein